MTNWVAWSAPMLCLRFASTLLSGTSNSTKWTYCSFATMFYTVNFRFLMSYSFPSFRFHNITPYYTLSIRGSRLPNLQPTINVIHTVTRHNITYRMNKHDLTNILYHGHSASANAQHLHFVSTPPRPLAD
jgi:hypothetical protein